MKIATIELIGSVMHHPNADKLDLATVLGFQVVVGRDTFKEGDKVLFVQPDSVLPIAPWTEELRKYAPKRIKAIRLRGEWSEGLVISLDKLPGFEVMGQPAEITEDLPEGTEVSEALAIVHYEPPAPNDNQAKASRLPFDIPKTDEERFENLKRYIPFGEKVDVTLKIDGQSWSAYYNLDTDEFGVCGRSQEMKLDCLNKFTAHIERYHIKEKLTAYCKEHGVSLCIRGESYGVGIQGLKHNPHSKMNNGLALFSVWNITSRRYERKGMEHYFKNVATEMDIPTVPFIEENVVLDESMLNYYSVGTESIFAQSFEGVVVQHEKGSFKIINKHYDSQK